jgi:hypothetical protein
VIFAIFGANVLYVAIPRLYELNEINSELSKLKESELQKSFYLFNFKTF